MMTKNEVQRHFKNMFSVEPLLVRAPGRFNLIGEHTDYNLGYVMPGAIDRQLFFALCENSQQNEIEMYSIDFQETVKFNLHHFEVEKKVSWISYIKAVVAELLKRGHNLKGFQGVFGGDIPIGAGLSSSAALCCGLIHGISEMQKLHISRKENALIAQAAEHRVGLNCGLMDQYAVLFGQKDHVLCLDCKTLDFQPIPIQLTGHILVLLDSNVSHVLAAGSGYNERRQSCERVVEVIRAQHPEVQSLRDVTMDMLEAHRSRVYSIDFQRSAFVLKENKRVLEMVEALKNGNLTEVGKLLNQAQAGLRHEYQVTVSETDFLVYLALREPSVLGARQVGGGFGGCVLVLMKSEGYEEILQKITGLYFKGAEIEAKTYIVKPEDGVACVA